MCLFRIRLAGGDDGTRTRDLMRDRQHRIGVSLILRHAWQRRSTQKHGKNAQVVLIWYSFRFTLPPRAPSRCDVFGRCGPAHGLGGIPTTRYT